MARSRGLRTSWRDWLVGAVLTTIALMSAASAEAAKLLADLAISSQATVSQIMPGGKFDYILTVTNNGPDDAEEATAAMLLPPGISISGCATVVAHDTTCTRFFVGSLAVGKTVSARVRMAVDADVSGELRIRSRVRDRATRDPGGDNDRTTTTVIVVGVPVPLYLFPLDTSLPSAFSGSPYSTTFAGTGGQAPLTLAGVDPPPGLTFSSTPLGDLRLAGTPVTTGDYVVTVTLTDSSSPVASIIRTYELSIRLGLTITPDTLPDAHVGSEYMVTFTAPDGFPPVSFTSSDPLPPGFELRDNSLVGTPTEAGTFELRIDAIDGQGNGGARAYTLVVIGA